MVPAHTNNHTSAGIQRQRRANDYHPREFLSDTASASSVIEAHSYDQPVVILFRYDARRFCARLLHAIPHEREVDSERSHGIDR